MDKAVSEPFSGIVTVEMLMLILQLCPSYWLYDLQLLYRVLTSSSRDLALLKYKSNLHAARCSAHLWCLPL